MTSPPHDPAAGEPADDRTLLLSAYVDGEATPDERDRVDNDPAMLAEARQLRSLKTSVANVTPPTPEARSRLLDAAMAEFTGATGPTPVAPLPPPTPGSAPHVPSTVAPMPPPAPARGPRRGRSPWLATAAAIVGVLAVGGAVFAVVQSDGGDGDSASDAGDAGDADLTLEREAETEAGRNAAEDAGEAATEDAGDSSQGAFSEEEQGDAAAAPNAPAEAEEPTPADGDDATATENTMAAMDEGESGAGMRQIDDEDDLAEWYEDVRYHGFDPPGRGTKRCENNLLGEAMHGDTLIYVITDRDANINALDAADCQVMMSTPVP